MQQIIWKFLGREAGTRPFWPPSYRFVPRWHCLGDIQIVAKKGTQMLSETGGQAWTEMRARTGMEAEPYSEIKTENGTRVRGS